MTELLFQHDSYLTEFDGKITKVNQNSVELDRSAFYPAGGGQPYDNGILEIKENESSYISLDVVEVQKTQDGSITHLTKETPTVNKGDCVVGKINWQRRYKFMRMHTASHILASITNDQFGTKIMGNQIGLHKTRFDFSLETFDRPIIDDLIRKTNDAILQEKEVRVYFLDREEALKIANITKLGDTQDYRS